MKMATSQNSISEVLMKHLSKPAEFVYLMGSAETDRFHPESDIDVAVFWKPDQTETDLKNVYRNLQKELDHDLDLIVLNDVDIIFARQVLETGRLLMNHSPEILLNWKMQTLSSYPDFKVSRKIIEDNILKRKKYV